MRTVLWLVLRELASRRGVVGALAVAATAVALCSGIELVSRAREGAVGAQIDRFAPPILMTVGGLSATELGRLEPGRRLLPSGLPKRVRQELAGSVRAVEARLVVRLQVAGAEAPIIGVEQGATATFESVRTLREGQLAVGAALAARLQANAGERLRVGASTAVIADVLPPAGSVEDLAAFAPLPTAQALAGAPGGGNEIRVYPLMGASAAKLEEKLRVRFEEAAVHRADRGIVADHETGEALRNHRLVIYALTALAAALCLLVGVHLHTTERRQELATLAAMGVSANALLLAVTLRAVVVGVFGALAGFAAACIVALVQDSESALLVLPAWPLLGVSLLASTAVSFVAAAPSALIAARRDPAAVLKEA
ncbi:MAG: hypothetical protein HY901_24760 [Deltaproteobacteria bacterium]|nr:hypothetical protein [Deltaproteobacteria bacterium]